MNGIIFIIGIVAVLAALIGGFVFFINKNEKTRKVKMAYYFLIPTLVGMFLIHLAPIAQGIWMSFLDVERDTIRSYLTAPWVGLSNYSEVLFNPNSIIRNGLVDAARNTLVYAFVVTLGTIVFGTLIAMLLNREFKFRGLARTLILFPWVVPTYVIGLLWGFMWLKNTGIINIILVDWLHILSVKPDWLNGPNTLWAIIIPTIWRFTPMTMLFLLAGLSNIGKDVYESADIDGANGIQKFFYITLPLLKPVIAVQIMWGMITNVYSFNIVIMMFGNGGGFPGKYGDLLMTNIFRNAFIGMHFGMGSAISVLLMFVMIILIVIWYRIFQENLTS